MIKTITILIDTTDSAMVGGHGWENCDPRASINEFKSQVITRVREFFPGYVIDIEETDHKNAVTFEDERGADDAKFDQDWTAIENDQQAVREIISDVWANADWYVEE